MLILKTNAAERRIIDGETVKCRRTRNPICRTAGLVYRYYGDASVWPDIP
jgi:hypothetical protein